MATKKKNCDFATQAKNGIEAGIVGFVVGGVIRLFGKVRKPRPYSRKK